ncbi:ABC-2 type transporter [uncultured Desulfatiglans sp.]|uniref:ABC-2 type transporter n=1 Tax=Uncultured Desulfatiglans sp. TaxID=1748965 RepID=A0A653AA23_UNCDX|nr:ABC-2 type transporter [uncultured Desulfatiglans sp.]
MKWKRIFIVAQKEWREILRDRLFFTLAFVVPGVLMLLFGYGISLDVENLPFAVVDHDRSRLSRDYAYRFIESRYFDFKGYLDDERDVDPLLSDNVIRAAVIIPEHFEKRLLAGRPAAVQTLIDGTFPSRAQTTKSYVTAINNAVTMELVSRHLAERDGKDMDRARKMLQPVGLQIRYLYNQSAKSIWSIAPSLLMVILMIAPPFLTAIGVVREKENGSIYNIYASTVSRGEFLIGKLAPYVIISTLNMTLLWVLAVQLYGAPFKGQLGFFLPASVLYLLCTTGIGLLISVFVRTQIAAIIVTVILTLVPAVLYSGFLIPIASLSGQAKITAHLIPAMYYTNIAVGSFLKGVGLEVLWGDLLVLAVYALIVFSAGFILFSKRPKA